MTIVERRPPWREGISPDWTTHGITHLRYIVTSSLWALYWRDRNTRWHRYDLLDPTSDVRVLLDEIDRDPTCIFWS